MFLKIVNKQSTAHLKWFHDHESISKWCGAEENSRTDALKGDVPMIMKCGEPSVS